MWEALISAACSEQQIPGVSVRSHHWPSIIWRCGHWHRLKGVCHTSKKVSATASPAVHHVHDWLVRMWKCTVVTSPCQATHEDAHAWTIMHSELSSWSHAKGWYACDMIWACQQDDSAGMQNPQVANPRLLFSPFYAALHVTNSIICEAALGHERFIWWAKLQPKRAADCAEPGLLIRVLILIIHWVLEIDLIQWITRE